MRTDSALPPLASGQQVCGKWQGQCWSVRRTLGEGTTGRVYLASSAGNSVAIKVCPRSADAALEWSILTGVHPQGGPLLFPTPLWIDDGPPVAPFFYAMEVVTGQPLADTWQTAAGSLRQGIVQQIGAGLHHLHQQGYIFGDFKPENILVDLGPPLQVRFVDVGGVTSCGRSVRQFTPQFDRAFWGLGSRRAEPTYDIAAFAITLLILETGSPPSEIYAQRPEQRRLWLTRQKACLSQSLAQTVGQGLAGSVSNAEKFTALCTRAMTGLSGVQGMSRSPQATALPPQRRPFMAKDWTEWLMWLSLVAVVSVTVVAWVTIG
ncbi:hypothetical protein D2Q93_14025 [Alicyclobacillaceae bacterium I2511]|nr:hypothetical protein D2Q93_14025 [Alicyclobacillaceae bacterium I2511]